MKKFKLAFILLACVFLVGCSNSKEMVDGNAFLERAKEAGFTPIDIKESYNSFATNAYLIDSDFKVIYVEGKNVYDIEGVFLDECNNVNIKLTKDAKVKHDSGKNWALYTATDLGNYFYISLIDNTYVYIEGKEENKDRINKLIDTIGY